MFRFVIRTTTCRNRPRCSPPTSLTSSHATAIPNFLPNRPCPCLARRPGPLLLIPQSRTFVSAASSRVFLSPKFSFPILAPNLCLCRSLVCFHTRRHYRVRNLCSSLSSSMEHPINSHIPVADGIQLTSLEQKIFDTLKAVLAHFELNIQLRVAGGWVRDKLLGKECHDIDIALDTMMGEEFCNKVNEYLTTINEQVCSVGVIKSNPDQSKHLETARLHLFDMWVDFVNLRSETYAENSRIPTMEYGTPKEDAYRRDLTINRSVPFEEWDYCNAFTSKTNFLDDPLRVLRAIRFAARFNYKIEKELKEAAADNEVKVALANKVSPERIGVEVDLMMACKNPVRAVQELVEVDIFWVVFRLPEDLKVHVPEETRWQCLRTVEYMSKILDAFGPSKLEPDQWRICYLAALLIPLRSIMYQDRRKKLIPLASVIIKESIKLKSKDADNVVSLHKCAEEFHQIIPFLLDRESREQSSNEITNDEDMELPKLSRKAIKAGLVLLEIKELWKAALVLSTVIELPEFLDKEIKESVDTCLSAEAMVLELGLENIWNVKPLLDGKMIMSELGLQKGGPIIKEWQEKLRKWQLCHLTATTEECLQWFREEYKKRLKV